MTINIHGSCHCGNVKWEYTGADRSVTACNCTLCRRYGALWIYGHLDEDINIEGSTKYYSRDSHTIEFHFCQTCGCTTHYQAHKPDAKNRFRTALNTRLATKPEQIATFPIDHFDGLDKFEDLPRDDRCVKDLWF